LTTRYQLPTSAIDGALNVVVPPLVVLVASEPVASASNELGTSTLTLPRSPNAHATKVRNADPTRMSLADRGAPDGRSYVTRTLALWLKNRDERNRTSRTA
jgi:uncharacterized protein (DUF3084 family)